MPWTERTVVCPECQAERTTKAGKGTVLACLSCGAKFPAPAPAAADPAADPAKGSRVKRAKASTTVVRQNARPRPKKTSPPAGPTPPTVQDPPPPVPDPAPKGDDEGRHRQRAAGRRGGLAYYQRLVAGRKAS
jgi:ribosomal protein L37AE/L43A